MVDQLRTQQQPDRAFEEWLEREIGLEATSVGRDTIRMAAERRMRACGLGDSGSYLEKLRTDLEERQQFVDNVIVPETWFFRDVEPFVLLAKLVVERIAAIGPARALRILSVPCSSGEEPYSIAMALLDAGVAPERFHVDAFDVSRVAIERARAARHTGHSFRGHDLAFRDRHFTQDGTAWIVNERVRNLVTFATGNLIDPAFPVNRQPYDVVFCRNLIIYQTATARDRIVSTLDRLLAADGFLFVGHAEVLPILTDRYKPIPHAGAFALARRPPAAPKPDPRVDVPAPKPPPQAVPRRRRTPPPLARRTPAPLARRTPRPSSGPKPSDARADVREARRLADLGRLDEAAQLCTRLLDRERSNAELHLVLGLVHEAGGRTAEAEESLRRALYLDTRNEEALLHLAVLLERRGDKDEARRLRARALRAGPPART